MRKIRIFLLVGAMVLSICGCKHDVKLTEDEIVTTVAPTEETTEIVTEETTTEKAEYTERMKMLLDKQEGDFESEYLDRVYLGDELMIAFPKNGTEQSGNGKFSAEKEGVFIEFKLNPYERAGIQYESICDSLDKVVNNYYGAGSQSCDDIEKDSAQAISDDTARAVVSFVDVSEDKPSACDTTMFLIDLDDENTVLIRLVVNYANTSSNTETILAALEEYYELDCLYDRTTADSKLAAYNKGGTNSNSGADDSSKMQTIAWNGYEFDIPSNWKKDNVNSSGNGIFYAPNGSVDKAGYAILLNTARGTTATVDTYLNNQAVMNQMFNELTGGMIKNVTFSDAGQTFLGHTLKMTFSMNIEGVAVNCVVYSNVSTSKMEMIGAYGIAGNTAKAESVLQEIMQNGR